MSASLRLSRAAGRITLNAVAELKCAEGTTSIVSIRDISQSGAFLETAARLPLFSTVSIRSATSNAGWLDAYVVRRDGGGVGLEWHDTGPQSMSTLVAATRATPAD